MSTVGFVNNPPFKKRLMNEELKTKSGASVEPLNYKPTTQTERNMQLREWQQKYEKSNCNPGLKMAKTILKS